MLKSERAPGERDQAADERHRYRVRHENSILAVMPRARTRESVRPIGHDGELPAEDNGAGGVPREARDVESSWRWILVLLGSPGSFLGEDDGGCSAAHRCEEPAPDGAHL